MVFLIRYALNIKFKDVILKVITLLISHK